ncbi:hypothetical protein [Puniceibacterium sp. IMCC21224]|uniref:PGN_0703 family putative restriction endonuclease n=1 Tax=Puniceibacterium sp. IMCC21224 TaxID=1618204 RepID=UPI00064DC199|nr:hypothetical protein [Puniceibacterium sp. IMCC21224]KMK66146.1 hypothetical protein IMCC21224_11993 [Puniceibacterium sp. IMCC21224]
MNSSSLSPRSIRPRTLGALSHALQQMHPQGAVDDKGYAASYLDNLLPLVSPADFEADLEAGDGNELATKFRAAHSSSALAVNCFAPFRSRLSDLVLPLGQDFTRLQFERKCPTGLRGGRAPNLDLVLEGATSVVGVESKLTEMLGRHRAAFSDAYRDQITDFRRTQGYFREMLRLREAPDSYARLDAAQLIKHAFGLARCFGDRPVTLLYLYWEPANPECDPIFAAHRREIAEFADRVADATPTFAALSYPELWAFWQHHAPPQWLPGHLEALHQRYGMAI